MRTYSWWTFNGCDQSNLCTVKNYWSFWINMSYRRRYTEAFKPKNHPEANHWSVAFSINLCSFLLKTGFWGKEAWRPPSKWNTRLFFAFSKRTMATLDLKEMGKFLWEGRKKSLPCWLSQFSKTKLRQANFFPYLPKEFSHFLQI